MKLPVWAALPAALFVMGAAAPPPRIDVLAVQRIVCGDVQGSAVPVGRELYTAAHVAVTPACLQDGVSGRVAYRSDTLDFARVSIDARGRVRISCAPIRRGVYYAVGWAFGEHLLVSRLTGLDRHETIAFDGGLVVPHLAVLSGRVFPGMSGGAVFDAKGRLAGTITGVQDGERPLSLVRQLADTPVCR